MIQTKRIGNRTYGLSYKTESYGDALRYAKQMKRKTKSRYQIYRKYRYGGWVYEVWLTKTWVSY